MTDIVFNCYVVRVVEHPEFFPKQYWIEIYLGDPDNGGTVVGSPVVFEDNGTPLALFAYLVPILAALPPCP